MSIKLIYQLVVLAITTCCIAAIMVITFHTMQDMIDSVSAYVSRLRVPMH